MRSPAAERRRPTLLDGAAALLVAAAAVALLFFLQPEESNFLTASVVLEGETIAEYELSTLTGPVTLVVDEAASASRRVRVPARTAFTPGGSAGPDSRSSACPTSW